VSDKFFNPVEVPVITDPPQAEVGFVRIYGRGDDAYALFGDGEEKLLTGGVVVVPGTERDISFPDDAFVGDSIFTRFVLADSGAVSDAVEFNVMLQDDAALSDAATSSITTRQNDSLATSDEASSTITTRRGDSLAASDDQAITVGLVDTGAASDARQVAQIDAVNWANVVEANSEFESPANLVDLSEATAATLTATRTALSDSVTVTGSIEVSLPDLSITPSPDVVSVELQWGWSAAVGGSNIARSGNSVDIDIEYSVDNGSTFTLLENVTTAVGSTDGATTITATYAQTQALRFRVSGSVVSGTNATLNASQEFNIFYVRADLSLTQTL